MKIKLQKYGQKLFLGILTFVDILAFITIIVIAITENKN